MDARITTLDNGVRVATAALPHVQSVSLGVWAGAGGRHESRKLAGVSHFIEHLLFKGTPHRGPRKISQEIEGRGGYLNAFTQEENTCFFARVPFNHMRRALDVLADMYLNASLSTTDIDRERGVILEEIMMYRDQPQHEVHDTLMAMLWHNHALGRPILGAPESLAHMTRETLSGYKQRAYVARNTVFAFAGRVVHDDCVARVAALTEGMPTTRCPAARAVTDAVGQRNTSFQAREIEQTHVAFGFRLFGRRDPRRHTLKLLSAVLGENMSSRLFQVVRERHGLAYAIHSGCHLFRDTGTMMISCGLDSKNLPRMVTLVLRELARLRDRPLSAAELRRAREYALGQLRLGLESTTNQMMWLGENLLTFGRCIPPEEMIAAVEAVSAADIQELAQAILRPDRLSFSVVSPQLPDSAVKRVGDSLTAW